MNRIDPKQLPVDFFSLTETLRKTHPKANAGVLAIAGAANPARHEELERLKRELENQLRVRYEGIDRAGLRAEPTLHAYEEYYRRFDKTYHVQLQLESILFKGRTLPSGAALVEAMFMAEVESHLLTAGHDLAALEGKIRMDVGTGNESYRLLRGISQTTKAGDMMICDEAGIISSILYGPDERTQIRPETREAVFTVYAPAGIPADSIKAHMEKILAYAKIIAPGVQTLELAVFPEL